MEELFKHVNYLDQSDDDDSVDFSKEEGEGYFEEEDEYFIDRIH